MATLRQQKAVEKIVENRGIVSKGMLESGYSLKSAKNPKNLTDSKAWPELVKKYFPDTKLAKKHNQLLNAESETVQLGALRLGYEVTGKTESESKLPTTHITNINFFSKPEVMAATKNLDNVLKEYLINETEKPAETL